MKKFFYLLFIITLCSDAVLPQVNTEKYRKEIDDEGFYSTIGIAAGLNKGNSDFVSVKGAMRFDYITEKADYFIVGNYEFKEGNDKKIVNKGFGHLRAIVELSDLMDIEFFAQKEFNQFILLKDRNLIGSGLRFNLLDYKSDVTGLRLFLGIGGMYERESFNTKPSVLNTSIFRSTNYFTVDWKINSFVDFLWISYFQVDAKSITDHRFLTDMNLNFRITSNITFTASFNLRYDNLPVHSIKKYDLELINGISFSF